MRSTTVTQAKIILLDRKYVLEDQSRFANHDIMSKKMLRSMIFLAILIQQWAGFCQGLECRSWQWACDGECIDESQSCKGTCKKDDWIYLCENDLESGNQTVCKKRWETCNGQCLHPEYRVYLPYSDACKRSCPSK